ncbi:hypothetical protein LMG29542_07582 [Paraburkholderia humisilvae]|uniref:Uncharacterized protein n=1 Tax=Paraburkholderia humisilvae TaxID=627669 RepID=A0A6J5F8Y0_9BURK|nr:hypothetical protein LMG29542_07582 [Paraburkholderia humisilvae]
MHSEVQTIASSTLAFLHCAQRPVLAHQVFGYGAELQTCLPDSCLGYARSVGNRNYFACCHRKVRIRKITVLFSAPVARLGIACPRGKRDDEDVILSQIWEIVASAFRLYCVGVRVISRQLTLACRTPGLSASQRGPLERGISRFPSKVFPRVHGVRRFLSQLKAERGVRVTTILEFTVGAAQVDFDAAPPSRTSRASRSRRGYSS